MTILTWPEAFAAGAARCGGKGHNLARLHRYGFNVPDGGVLTTDTYVSLMADPSLAGRVAELASVGANDVLLPEVVATLGTLREAIQARPLPEPVRTVLREFLASGQLGAVAVRSSAIGEDGRAASFAGIHESVLNVRGAEAIEAAILRCFASLWTPEALAYRRRLALADADVSCGVVILAMVHAAGRQEPASAGVAFSCDPGTGRREIVVINAAAGMGDKVVLGHVNPEQVQHRHAAGRVSDRAAAQGHPVLNGDRQVELARLVWRIHWALGEGQDPQDVEWAHDGDRFWIVQARPVTRPPRYGPEGVKRFPRYWSTANIKDAIPGVVSTAAWSLIVETIDVVLYAGPEAAGVQTLPGIEHVRRFSGRAYFDLTTMQWQMYNEFGVLPRDLVRSFGGHQPEIEVPASDPLTGEDGRRRRKNMLKLARALLSVRRRMQNAGPRYLAKMREFAAADFAGSTSAQLLEWLHALEREAAPVNALVGLANNYPGMWHTFLEALLRKAAPDRGEPVMSRLLAGGGNVTSAEQAYRVHDLAQIARDESAAREWLKGRHPAADWTHLPATSAFRRELERFLADFGHRTVYEADILNARWIDDPEYILDQVRAHLEAGAASNQRERAARVQKEGRQELARLPLWSRWLVRLVAGKLQQGVALREFAKSVLASTVQPWRSGTWRSAGGSPPAGSSIRPRWCSISPRST